MGDRSYFINKVHTYLGRIRSKQAGCFTINLGGGSKFSHVKAEKEKQQRRDYYVGCHNRRNSNIRNNKNEYEVFNHMLTEKKIIIVADCFNVDKLVGSRRVTALTSFLLNHGIRPKIITTHPYLYHTTVENELLEEELLPIRIISKRFYWLCRLSFMESLRKRASKHRSLYQRFALEINSRNRNSLFSMLKRIHNRILLTIDYFKVDHIFDRALEREKKALGKRYAIEVEKLISTEKERVTIITSVGGDFGYFEEGPIQMMRYLLKSKVKFQWIYDMRDKLHTENASEERNKRAVAVERFIYKHAKYIVAVSYGERQAFADALGLSYEEREKIKVIYNGYMKPDRTEMVKDNSFDQRLLHIVYTGKVYAGIFHSDMLFEAIAQLIDEDPIYKKTIRFHYAGSEARDIYKTAKKYGCESIFVNHGYLNLREIKRLQVSGDILFGMTKNLGCDIGRIPYKVMEYLGYEKPIIVIVAGDKPKAEVKYILEETRAGVVYDEIDYERNLKQLKEYLLVQYMNKKCHGKVSYNGNREALVRYSCDHQFFNYMTLL